MGWITEQRAVDNLIVYGFLRGPASMGARLRALSVALNEYCRQHELTLGGVFTERPEIASPEAGAFDSLLAALRSQRTYGVILPTRSHLGPRRLATSREQQITTCGARLIAVRDPTGSSRRPPEKQPSTPPPDGFDLPREEEHVYPASAVRPAEPQP